MSRGKACAGESAQAVTLRPRWFEFNGTESGCAGGAAQEVVSSRRSASELFFGPLSSWIVFEILVFVVVFGIVVDVDGLRG